MSLKLDAVHNLDCLEAMARLPAGSVDLAFADPPFNIGYTYDVYDDKRDDQAYLDWSKQWMQAVHRVLKNDGTFWLAIGDEYAAELKVTATQQLGFVCRSWVVWYYTFGVNCKYKFTRSHAHLFYFVKDPQSFTFNDQAVRVPSARQLVYADRRANPKGRLPDDTWILRPQDLPDGFRPDQDTWYFPRVAGTFKERAGFHGCQMPEQLLGRIIRACSNEGDLVLDPFAGSGTTLAVAKKLGRRWLGLELSKDYVKQIRTRLRKISPGDPLDGAPEPLVSVPTTAQGRIRDESGKSRPHKPKPTQGPSLFDLTGPTEKENPPKRRGRPRKRAI
jgi:site-specific DNA-methyltransferase (adenine-specific)